MMMVEAKDDEDDLMKDGDDTLVAFEHKFFTSVDAPYFRLSEQEDEAVMVIRLSDEEAVLPLGGIRREFDFHEESIDGKMLCLVEEALDYVNSLRIGDPLPSEILTGEASWEVSERHRTTAYHRLTVQLVSWLSGDEQASTNPEELKLIAEDPETKTKVNLAFAEAATELGLGADQTETVLSLIMTLAEELSHIESLREQFQNVHVINDKIAKLQKTYSNEISVMEILNPVARLLTVAIKEYQDLFDQVDAQTGEIMSVLKNIGSQTQFIHKVRDDLYRRLRAWSKMFKLWDKTAAKRSREAEDALRSTYQFLAKRFMPVDEWVLFSQLQDGGDSGVDTSMRW
ncbi:MAG: hypothetical protein ISR48_05045 [Alphaproteobacteria bacterium]|nr:hypothetical protein [Alphaproteobacteria bacterium]